MQTATAWRSDSLPSPEPGSFRDRGNRVFYVQEQVYRGLDAYALDEWKALAGTRLFHDFTAAGKLVRTEETPLEDVRRSDVDEDWAALLQHERIPFVSYPYEWCFGMLRDAALLQLELLEAALKEDLILKDASAYNVQWRGVTPAFIDIPSLVRLRPGEPWAGYRQFCQHFLFPLMLQAYRNVAFHPWLRGRLDGVRAEELNRLMSIRDWLRPGVFLDVFLQTRLQARHADTARDVRRDLRSVGFNKSMIQANAARLRKIVGKLAWKQARSEWSEYESRHSYDRSAEEQKKAFVRDVVESRPWKRVWDLGCNTGTYSRIAARNAEYVVAMDADPLAVERFYQRLKEGVRRNILPLVCDIANPSPNLGWRGRERMGLPERGTPDLTLCLALVHHLVIGANIPMGELIGWLADLDTDLVIEFVSRSDPMVRTLLRNREDRFADYDEAWFERCLGERFNVARRELLDAGTRTLYWARPRR